MKPYKQSVFFSILGLGLLQLMMVVALVSSSIAYSASPQPATKPTPDLATLLPALVARADTVVRAQVMQSTTRWNSSHTLLETEHKLAVRYTLVGTPTREVLVYTDGGFLAAEGIGMHSSHTPSFMPGEEVLVFLEQTGSAYRVIQGEAGKLAIFHTDAVSSHYQTRLSLDQTATTIQAAAQRQGQRATLPTNWRAYEMTDLGRHVDMAQATLADPKWPGATPKIKVKVNLNSSHIGEQGGTAEEFLTAITNALRTWSVISEAEFTFLYDGPTSSATTGFNSANEIVFMAQGSNSPLGKALVWYTSNGTILEGDIWINEDYQVDATTNPMSNEIDLESIVLHELGHWLPLSHINAADAVMYAALSPGVRKTVLHDEDRNGITALYPCPATPCIDPTYSRAATMTPTATETPTPTLTATLDPSQVTHTPTPTLAPSAVTPAPEINIFLPLVTQ